MFRITPNAAEQIRKAAKQSGTEGMALRLAVREKADGAFDYKMGFDEAVDGDLRIQSEGIEVVMDPKFQEKLDECVLDFVELEPGNWQFIFLNPADPHYVPPKEH